MSVWVWLLEATVSGSEFSEMNGAATSASFLFTWPADVSSHGITLSTACARATDGILSGFGAEDGDQPQGFGHRPGRDLVVAPYILTASILFLRGTARTSWGESVMY